MGGKEEKNTTANTTPPIFQRMPNPISAMNRIRAQFRLMSSPIAALSVATHRTRNAKKKSTNLWKLAGSVESG